MTDEELYRLLEIESPADMEYFEQLAELLETDSYIEEHQFQDVLSEIRAEDLGEIIENYFEEMTGALPDDMQDLFMELDALENALLLMAADMDRENIRYRLVSELYRFHEWYCTPDKVSVNGSGCSVRDAIAALRADRIGAEDNYYELSGALDYELPEMSMGIGSFENREQ